MKIESVAVLLILVGLLAYLLGLRRTMVMGFMLSSMVAILARFMEGSACIIDLGITLLFCGLFAYKLRREPITDNSTIYYAICIYVFCVFMVLLQGMPTLPLWGLLYISSALIPPPKNHH